MFTPSTRSNSRGGILYPHAEHQYVWSKLFGSRRVLGIVFLPFSQAFGAMRLGGAKHRYSGSRLAQAFSIQIANSPLEDFCRQILAMLSTQRTLRGDPGRGQRFNRRRDVLPTSPPSKQRRHTALSDLETFETAWANIRQKSSWEGGGKEQIDFGDFVGGTRLFCLVSACHYFLTLSLKTGTYKRIQSGPK